MEIDLVRKSEVPIQKTEVAKLEPKNSSESLELDKDDKKIRDSGSKTVQESSETQTTADNQQLKNAVNDLNKRMHNSEAVFGIHDKTNRVTIKIIDKSTKEIIKEYPPEQTLDMIAKVWEVAGILVDEKR